VYYCPHRPDEHCACRKPAPGLVQQAARELGFAPQQAFVIGDKACDIALGHQIGAVTFLVTTGYGLETLADPQVQPDFVVDTLAAAAQVIAQLLTVGGMPPGVGGRAWRPRHAERD
jgi:D-glycero-D-manno-heptose 1,7-bisphosphate phosphatase